MFKIPVHAFPDEEREAARQLQMSVAAVEMQCSSFQAALSLYDYCSVHVTTALERGDFETRRLLGSWQHIAMRDGAMTIYHFWHALQGANGAIAKCPTLSPLVRRDSLGTAFDVYRAAFPRSEAVRHGVSHSAEMTKNQKKFTKHVAEGPWNAPGIDISEGVEIFFGGSSADRQFIINFEGAIVSYELSSTTMATLNKCYALLCESLNAACEELRRRAFEEREEGPQRHGID